MSMVSSASLFPEIGQAETRSAQVSSPALAREFGVPQDEYAFVEWYCVDPGCDCRRVMFTVLARYAGRPVASISHSFEPPGKDAFVTEQTYLEPLQPQAPFAKELMTLLEEVVLADPAYVQRLHRHYAMLKDAVKDPAHPIHQRLAQSMRQRPTN